MVVVRVVVVVGNAPHRFPNPAGANRAGFLVLAPCPKLTGLEKGQEHGNFGHAQPGTSFTGAQLIVHLLERHHITVAGIPAARRCRGALSQSTRIHHVLARHEQGAGFMAQGMARANGGGVHRLQRAGRHQPVTAIADAKLDSIPLVCTGQVPPR